ncbi:MAG: alpha-L-glutamate ligase [bacterium]|nr:alpha-L-glutamate ligase [bacterium]
MKVYIIHENDEWTLSLKLELKKLEVNFEDWHVEKANIDLGKNPPEGIFYNRMSASSHARGHRYAPEFTATILNWLKHHKRRIINNGNALALEISKSLQYLKLNEAGIKTPKSIYCNSKEQIIKAADHFSKPFITKHNRAGRGLGVKLFQNKDELKKYVNGSNFEHSIDGITILQDYIEANPKVIHRVEFINSKFFYTVQVDASESFELCPADACNVEEQFCPTNPDGNKFMILKDYKNSEIATYEKFLEENDIEIAGIEYITDTSGIHYSYDVNTNTNYNSVAEKKAGMFGMKQIALFLKEELKKI